MKKLVLIFVFILSFGLSLFGEERVFFVNNENFKINDIRAKLKISEDKARIDFYKKNEKNKLFAFKEGIYKDEKINWQTRTTLTTGKSITIDMPHTANIDFEKMTYFEEDEKDIISKLTKEEPATPLQFLNLFLILTGSLFALYFIYFISQKIHKVK